MNPLITQFGEGVALAVVGVASYAATKAAKKYFAKKKLDRELDQELLTLSMASSSKKTPAESAPADPPVPTQSNSGFIFVSYKREDMPRIVPYLHQVNNPGASSGALTHEKTEMERSKLRGIQPGRKDLMKELGYEIWYDRGIPGGAEWDTLIEEKVSHCEILIVFLSDAAVDSKWVRREIKFADSEKRPILGVRLDKNVQLRQGLKIVMNQFQMIDASDADFSDELRKAIKYVRLL